VTVALGLSAALCWAIDNLVAVRITRTISAGPALAWTLASGLALGVPAWLLLEGLPSSAPPTAALSAAVIAAPAYLAGNAFFFLALRRGSLSIVAPLVGLEGGIAALIGVVVLGQPVGVITGIGLVLAVAGGTLAATQGAARAAAGSGWALASAASFATTFVCYGEADGMSPLGVVLTSRGLAVALLAAWLLARRERLALPSSMRRATVALGSLDVVAFTLFATAAAIGPIAVASVTGAQFATLAAALGVVVLGERLRPAQYAGVAITLVAVLLLSAGE